MSEDDYDAKRKEYGDEFIAMMGAEGIKDLLEEHRPRRRDREAARRPDRLRSSRSRRTPSA